ncbi:phosphomethylpyrimidine synthase ThiC [Peptoniphilus equinus]|uniref:Phosphomethylpyrimidine synthase n=1 Tax=Peptoniphilus equinus TaxID=3016343 RepID=A0ABY7QV27_9FIRM|nr:phosphomethylpyrimidine synthase ThiC [Peptoniphilus equinus]WBW50631.1 phosphomethylpyrimidine synthase ThiC [Peptoniphilus equinus]
MTYTTQLDAAKKKIITKEMKCVAEKEHMAPELLCEKIAAGRVVIPANIMHTSLSPEGVGEGLRTKINVNLGISKDCYNIDAEMKKVQVAVDMKAEAIMDLSNYGKTRAFREAVVNTAPCMIGSVPMYDCVGMLDKELKDITEDEFLKVIEQHAKDGVDFITVHVGLTRALAEKVKDSRRITHIVSRGGSLLFAWMLANNKENPLTSQFDQILDICEKYDVTLSLGDACRPGSIHDATDTLQIQELINLAALSQRAYAHNVQVMIEGPGHVAIDDIEANMLLEKRLCNHAPFYVLGPIVTDIAPGYDHITSAIGASIAASKGADFICYVTPAEHLRLPDLEDMKEGIIAAKIAAHVGDIAKGIPGAIERDHAMSRARFDLDWNTMFELAIDSEKPKAYRANSQPIEEDSCTMCGKMCSMRTVKKVLHGDDVNLM